MKTWVGIDLFSGAGGMSLGAKSAGIDVLAAVESCQWAAATYRHNFPETPVFQVDARQFSEWPKHPKGKNTILFGGPPCQGFSTSNQRNRCRDNPKNHLVFEFVRGVREWSPDVCVMENVKGILETDHASFLRESIEQIAALGYRVQTFVLNAVDFGVPQRRTRVFVVGRRGCKDVNITPRGGKATTVWDAIHDLPLLANGADVDNLPYLTEAESEYANALRGDAVEVTGNIVTRNSSVVVERYSHIKPGQNWEAIPHHLMTSYNNRTKCHTGIYRRLRPCEPSVVIGNFRKNMLIHPYANRGLSVREAARIQSVPDWFRFSGSIGFQQQQVGNVVPPLMAHEVFGSVVSKGKSWQSTQ